MQNCFEEICIYPLQWRHNGRYGVSNHQRIDCFLNRLFRRRSKKTSKLSVAGLCECTGDRQRENVSIWWRHHVSYSHLPNWNYTLQLCHMSISSHWHFDCMCRGEACSSEEHRNQRSALLALGEGNPSANGGIPSQRASNAESVVMHKILFAKKGLMNVFLIHFHMYF